MPQPSASRMRSYVQLQHNVPTANTANGELIDTWTTYANVWASFDLVTGTDLQVQQAVTLAPVKQYRVACRWFGGLSQNDLIVWGSRVFTINSFDDPNGTHQWYVITATETLR